jgi:hypothetical protein
LYNDAALKLTPILTTGKAQEEQNIEGSLSSIKSVKNTALIRLMLILSPLHEN